MSELLEQDPCRLVRAMVALVCAQKDLEQILKDVTHQRSEEVEHLQTIKDRVDAVVDAQDGLPAFTQNVLVAIGAFRAHMLDPEIREVNKLLYQRAVAPFRIDTHA